MMSDSQRIGISDSTAQDSYFGDPLEYSHDPPHLFQRPPSRGRDMQIKVQSGDIATASADAIVVNLFEGVSSPGGGTGAVDQAMGGVLSQLITAGDIRGKLGEFTIVHTLGKVTSPRVIVAGLGKRTDFNLDKIRSLSAELARYLRRQRLKNVALITHGAGIGGLDAEACAAAIAEGTALGLYRFLRHKKSDEDSELETLTIVEHDGAKLGALQRGVDRGLILAEATNFCR